MQNSSTVPTNKLQQRLQHYQQGLLAPGSGVKHTAIGRVLRIVDLPSLLAGDQPEGLQNLLLDKVRNNPETLFAEVMLVSGKKYILPFQDSKDHIYSLYGNNVQLTGRDVIILFENNSYSTGRIHFSRGGTRGFLDIDKTTKTNDLRGTVI